MLGTQNRVCKRGEQGHAAGVNGRGSWATFGHAGGQRAAGQARRQPHGRHDALPNGMKPPAARGSCCCYWVACMATRSPARIGSKRSHKRRGCKVHRWAAGLMETRRRRTKSHCTDKVARDMGASRPDPWRSAVTATCHAHTTTAAHRRRGCTQGSARRAEALLGLDLTSKPLPRGRGQVRSPCNTPAGAGTKPPSGSLRWRC